MASKISIILVWFCTIALLVIGLVMVASTGVWAEPADASYTMLARQSTFAGVGLVMAMILARIDYRFFRQYVWWILGFACVLLALCYIPPIGEMTNGEYRWINLGFIRFQPSECAKLAMMMSVAHWYTVYREKSGTLVHGFILPGIVLLVPFILIFFEKDMGTACALGIAGLCVMYVAGANTLYLSGTVLGGFAGLCAIVMTNANRMERIKAWTDLEAYKLGAGLQQFRAEMALERGGFWGMGIGNSAEKHGMLPFAHTDFIYAIIGEEYGFIGTMGVLLLFFILVLSGVIIATQTSDLYGRLLAVGIVATIFCPAVLNISVVTALVPNSGLPLPFISFGGTNLVFTLIAIGMLTSIQRHSSSPPPQYVLKRRNQKTQDMKL